MKTEVLEKPHARAPILGNKNKEKEEIFSKWCKLLKPEVLLHFATLKKSGWRPCLPLCQPAGLLARRQGHSQDLQCDCGRPPGTVSLMLRRHQHKTCVPCNILVPLCEKDPLLLSIHLGSQPWGSRTGNTQKSDSRPVPESSMPLTGTQWMQASTTLDLLGLNGAQDCHQWTGLRGFLLSSLITLCALSGPGFPSERPDTRPLQALSCQPVTHASHSSRNTSGGKSLRTVLSFANSLSQMMSLFQIMEVY